MSENWHIPTEQELDALLEQAPQFDPEAVKHRTMQQIGAGQAARPRGKKLPLRGLCIAAVVCALSISALAAADHVTGGKIKQVLTIQRTETEKAAPAPEPEPEPAAETPAPQPAPVPEPEPVKEEPPELDQQVADALNLTPVQAETLRPAVQKVEETVENRDVRMTVLQTVGDPSCLYIKLRFDFPDSVTTDIEADFDKIEFSLSGARSYGWHHRILEQAEHSATYLIEVRDIHMNGAELMGQTATLTCSNYGREIHLADKYVQFELREGEVRIIIVDPEGNINAKATEEQVAALAAGLDSTKTTEDGFTVVYLTDGTQVVTYDGEHGIQYVTVTLGDAPVVIPGADPTFKAALNGTWTQSWQLSYQDASVYWHGEAALSTPALKLTGFRLSPLSWSADFTLNEYADLLSLEWEAQLLHADGSITEFPTAITARWAVDEDHDFPCSGTGGKAFDQPIDLTDVTAILIDGEEFPLSSK